MVPQPTPLFRDDEQTVLLPVSDRIRARLERARQRYHANDNISAFMMDGEVEALQTEVETKMADVLKSLVIDTDSDHNTRETARRVAKMFLTEVFKGRYLPMPAVTAFPNVEQLNELLVVGPSPRAAPVRTICARSWARSGSASCPTNNPT